MTLLTRAEGYCRPQMANRSPGSCADAGRTETHERGARIDNQKMVMVNAVQTNQIRFDEWSVNQG